jgi:hypothetical protein
MKKWCYKDLQGQFDKKTAYLRHLSYKGHEVLSALYPAVRSADWSTLTPGLTSLKIRRMGNSFIISFKGISSSKGIPMVDWSCQMTMKKEKNRGSFQINLTYRGEWLQDFECNRIGLCYHLPLNYKNSACIKRGQSGESEMLIFPQSISPHQPMKDLTSLKLNHPGGFQVDMTFSETHEMEDQRNWTDSSFKLYSPPLEEPFPRSCGRGEIIDQSFTLVLGPLTRNSPFIVCSDSTLIGKGAAFFSVLNQDELIDRFLSLKETWKGKTVAMTLILNDSPEKIFPALKVLCALVKSLHLLPVWAPSMTTGEETDQWEKRLIEQGKPDNLLINRGTRGNFAELNRKRPPAACGHEIVFAAALGVHSSDEASWLENLEGFEEVLKNAGLIYPGRELAIYPAGIGQSWNPVALTAAERAIVPVQTTHLSPYLIGMMIYISLKQNVSLIGFHDLINEESCELMEALSLSVWTEQVMEEDKLMCRLTLKGEVGILKIRMNHNKKTLNFKLSGED